MAENLGHSELPLPTRPGPDLVGVWPGIEPRIVLGRSATHRTTLVEELALGSYHGLDCGIDVAQLGRAGLRGRGGSGAPAERKWRAVAEATGPTVVVANGEEGEPASLKDRWLLTHRPHAVIDGAVRAAVTVGAQEVVLYLAHKETIAAVGVAIAELSAADLLPADLSVRMHAVEPSYIAGEETAACRAIGGGPALPTGRPPWPSTSGVRGQPTLVSNVETLAHAAWIHRHGPAAYRAVGTSDSPGTTLATLTGTDGTAGVFEVPYGIPVGELFRTCHGGEPGPCAALLMGGWFGGMLHPDAADLPLTYEAVTAAGSGLGCAAITLLGIEIDLLQTAAGLAAWFRDSSAGQCGVCVRGTAAIASTLARLSASGPANAAMTDLRRWGATLRGRGACALLDGAANLARSTVEDALSVEPAR